MANQNVNPGATPEQRQSQQQTGKAGSAQQTSGSQQPGPSQGKQYGQQGSTSRQNKMTRGSGGYGMARRDQYPSIFSPFGMMRRMMEDMDRMFGGFAGYGGGLGELGGGWSPQLELFEKDGYLVVRADLPGLKEEDVKVEVQADNTLLIEGERKSEQEDEREGIYRSERSYGSFRRVIALPEGIDAEHAEAKFQNGVLEVCLKLPDEKEQAQTRRIQVKGGSQAQQGGGEQQKPPVH